MSTLKQTRYVAFLRAINVGGRRVKMPALKAPFEALGLRSVSTFIASGSVIFDSSEQDPQALRASIEGALKEALGFEVETFLRTATQLQALSEVRWFDGAEATEGLEVNVAFVSEAVAGPALGRVMALGQSVKALTTHDNHVAWLRRKGDRKSGIATVDLERALGAPATVRTANTIRRIVARFCAA